MTERYGNVRIAKIRSAYNVLREAVRSGDFDRANAALDRYEQWANFAEQEKANDETRNPKARDFRRSS